MTRNYFLHIYRPSDIGYPSYMSREMIDKFGRKTGHTPPKKEFKSMYNLKNQQRYSYSGAEAGPSAGGPQKCSPRPKQPMNASMQCAKLSHSCQVTCNRDYLFPNGETTLYVSCVDGEWAIKGLEHDEIPSCERKILRAIMKMCGNLMNF